MFLRESDADLKTTKEYELDSERGRDRERERFRKRERKKMYTMRNHSPMRIAKSVPFFSSQKERVRLYISGQYLKQV